MANVFYDPGEQRATKVKALFGRIAPRYDLINDLQSFGLHRYWKRRLVRLAAPQPGERALDLCCGTGDLAFLLAQRGVEVVGCDFSQQMLAEAKSKVQSPKSKVHGPQSTVHSPQSTVHGPQSTVHGPQSTVHGPQSTVHSPQSTVQGPRPTVQGPGSKVGGPQCIIEAVPHSAFRTPHFVQGDAQQLPFRADSFDIVTVGYGLRNLADWESGLREMRRVTKPGGRLLVLDFGKPDNPVWRSLYFGYLRFFVPLLGKIFCGDAAAYGYILESLRHYPAQQGVAGKMRELGLVQARLINLLGGVMSINYGCKV